MIAEGRGEVTDEEFQEEVRKALEEFGPQPSEGPWEEVRRRLLFAGGGFTVDDPGSLLDVLSQAKKELGGSPQLIHYMAVPPSAFGPLTEAIGAHGLAAGSRVVYEKPFGTSLESFRQLDKIAHATFEESQIYRIDHFLGKEATQNIHVLRFANGLFAGAWDSSHIESVQIDVPETLDVAMRADFYDATGAILDMLVTHLFQIAGEIAMEPPHCLEPDCLAEAREAVIGCFRPLSASDVVVGQYDGYRGTGDVPDDSRTETYVAARMWIDNERWKGVPFLLAYRQVPRREPTESQRGLQGRSPGATGSTGRRKHPRIRAVRGWGDRSGTRHQGAWARDDPGGGHNHAALGLGEQRAVAPGILAPSPRCPDR